jgi:hypothetical protein
MLLLLGLMGSAWAAESPADSAAETGQSVVLAVNDPASIKGDAIAATTREFVHRLVIELKAVKPAAALQVQASPLTGPDGITVQPVLRLLGASGPEVQGEPKAPGFIDLGLGATLPRLGEYTGWIRLQYGNGPVEVRPLRISRADVEMPLEVLGLERVVSGSSPFCLRAVRLWLSLQALSDRPLELTPSLTDLALKQTSSEKLQAQFDSLTFAVDGRDIAGPLALEPNKTQRLELALCGLTRVGEYVGNLRINAPGFKPKNASVAILVKDAWWIAAVAIALGAAASMWIRRYGVDRRPRLVVRQRVARLRHAIYAITTGSNAPEETEAGVLRALDQRIVRLGHEAEQLDALPEGWAARSAQLARGAEDKLAVFVDWVNARRRIAALRPPDIAVPLRATLAQVEQALLAEADVPAEQKAALGALPGQIEFALQQAFKQSLDAFEKELAAQHQATLASMVGVALWGEVRHGLVLAREHVEANDLKAASAAFEEARLGFARLLVDELRQRLAAARLPEGMTQADWDNTCRDVERLMEASRAAPQAEDALNTYRDAYHLYLRTLVGALTRSLDGEQRIHALRKKLADAELVEFDRLVQSALEQTRSADSELISGHPREAQVAYESAANAWREARAKATGGVRMDAAAAARAASAPGARVPAGVSEAASTPIVAPPLPAVEDERELSARTRHMDRIFDWIALAVSVALGVVFVWMPNATWGGLGDWLLALLWGIGLHQVSGFTFDGVLGIREKLVK